MCKTKFQFWEILMKKLEFWNSHYVQQSLNVEGLPFIVTKNSKEALREQAVAMLMLDLKRAEERTEMEGWVDADDLERELGVIDWKR